LTRGDSQRQVGRACIITHTEIDGYTHAGSLGILPLRQHIAVT